MNAAGVLVRTMAFRWLTLFAAIVSIAMSGGCSRPSGPPRHHFAGTVTYDEKPLAMDKLALRRRHEFPKPVAESPR